MGAYLSEPLTTKDSSDESNDYLLSGSSSMQGWRISQEDAHNCILNFDDNSSFFAVYDGHGGAEVAQYCSVHLPTFLKTVEAYGRKEFEKALKEAFLGFDATLLQEKVIEELKLLSDKTNDDEEEADEEEEEDDNVEDLCKEAVMPLNEVLQKYRKDLKQQPAGPNQRVAAIKEGNCSKPISPYLKGKRRGTDGAGGSGASTEEKKPAASDAEADPAASGSAASATEASSSAPASASKEPGPADSTVSSSSSNKAVERVKEATPQPEPSSSSSGKPSPSDKTEPTAAAAAAVVAGGSKKAEQSNEISDTAGNVAVKPANDGTVASGGAPAKENCAPDSSSSDGSKQAGKVNGDVGKVASSGAVSSSCSSASSAVGQENGSCDSGAGSSPTKVHSSSAKVSPSKNGPSAPNASMSVDDTDDDDDDDDESDSDEEFPHAEEPTDDTSSTDDGEEEEPYGGEEEEEDGSDGEEGDEEEEGDYVDLGEYINEEDAAFMKTITDEPGKDSGCTAVVALLHGKDLYVANAGDSRCVVCRNGKALDMSFDHKPEDTIEYERIEKAGGRVTLDGRVNGGLNLSRAIGDHGYKMNKSLPAEEQMISALPDIEKITIGPEDEFMVLACDGIWNYLTSEQVVQFVQDRIHRPGMRLSTICEELFDHCLAPHTRGDGTGCDNMTAIIVQFKPNFTGAASRKRTASNSEAVGGSGTEAAVSSATKKVKTDEVGGAADDASSTTDGSSSSSSSSSNGASARKEPDATEETEAAAAVASIASDETPMDTATGSSEAASSST
uniref:protein-serine/threonine phosphatase n=1 Tax=Anopheles dirus TaxID=7168 RepID=A0A182NK15_9DIPT